MFSCTLNLLKAALLEGLMRGEALSDIHTTAPQPPLYTWNGSLHISGQNRHVERF